MHDYSNIPRDVCCVLLARHGKHDENDFLAGDAFNWARRKGQIMRDAGVVLKGVVTSGSPKAVGTAYATAMGNDYRGLIATDGRLSGRGVAPQKQRGAFDCIIEKAADCLGGVMLVVSHGTVVIEPVVELFSGTALGYELGHNEMIQLVIKQDGELVVFPSRPEFVSR